MTLAATLAEKATPVRRRNRHRVAAILGVSLLVSILAVNMAAAQLPPEAVDLALVKIPETLTSVDLCPVHLEPSDAEGESWTHEGVDYRGIHGARTRLEQEFGGAARSVSSFAARGFKVGFDVLVLLL